MSILRRILNFFDSPGVADSSGYWVYVRCGMCGESLKTRINLGHDLSSDYGGSGNQAFFTRKTMVGSSGCFQRIEIELGFNQQRKLVNREISGGTFIDPEEILAEDEPSK